MLDVVINQDAIRIGPRFAVTFQRTLRIPDDGRAYPLPPGLGRFPVLKVEDYLDRVPPAWREHGGAFIPMYQREALWLGFHAAPWKPNAVKIAVGRINAISGEPDDAALHADRQDYVVCPEQPWLDGIHTGHGLVRQFVAMPLGLGYTVEASMTGAETFGGIQITVFEPEPGRFSDEPPIKPDVGPVRAAMPKPGGIAMGLGAGGAMKQKIYPDPHGIEVWDQGNYGRIFIHILNSAQFFEITGLEAPPTPIDAKTYTEYGLPWFELYDETKGDVPPSDRLAGVKTISAGAAERGEAGQTDASFEVSESQIEKLPSKDSGAKDRQPSSPNSQEHSPERE
ncbi:MAG TPA: hypothetical protein VLU73_02185 [Methylococcaceae bacterium]|jgi:hypothetical protein|nr:hypothetical protein [Methylococcaceae bacterium]